MLGIISCGAYIPKYRLSRDSIAHTWGTSSIGGEKAVANYDEDSVTMAVEAAFDCLSAVDPQWVDGLYFASTTSPYREKQSSSLIATPLDLRRDILTSDFSNSLRAGASALTAGMNAISNKSARQVLVTVADCRLGPPGSDLEQTLGDGAAAFLLGDSDDVVANITGSYALSDDFTDYWRTEQDAFTKSWEDRFANIWGYMKNVQEVATGIMGKYNLTPADFSKLVAYAPNPRQHIALARELGFDAKRQLSDLLFKTVGNTGAALAPMMLVEALEEAKSGDKLLFISYGDGSQAFIIEVTDNIIKIKDKLGIKGHLSLKAMLDSYEEYLSFRNFVIKGASRRFPAGNSLPILWRQKKSLAGFYGSKCKRCSLIQYPIQRVCYHCGSLDEFEEVKLAKRGTIFSYTEDYIAFSPQLPQGWAIIYLDDGARVYVELTEIQPEKPTGRPTKIQMPVEMTFRRTREADGFLNYYWKARPGGRK